MDSILSASLFQADQAWEISNRVDELLREINEKWPGLTETCYDQVKFRLIDGLNKSANRPTAMDRFKMRPNVRTATSK